MQFVAVDAAIAQVHDALAAFGNALVVRHHDDRKAALVQLGNKVEDRFAGLGIQVTRGLVGHGDGRGCDQGPCNGCALLLSARQLAWSVRDSIGQADHIERLDRPRSPLNGFHALIEQRYLDVLHDRQLADEIEGLEYEADLAAADLADLVVLELGDIVTVEQIRASRGLIQTTQDVHEGALARARSTHDGDKLALGDVQVDMLERFNHDRAVGLEVALGDIA